jgi:hypothetical protein
VIRANNGAISWCGSVRFCEDAEEQIKQYRENLLAVVSDVQFPRGGVPAPEAGFELAHLVRELLPDVPTVLHSSHTEFRSRAHAEGFTFLQKRSPTFLRDFRRLLTQQCAFGDFVFRTPEGTEVARASDMNALEAQLHTVPGHTSQEPAGAGRATEPAPSHGRGRCPTASVEHLRHDLIESINDHRREQSEYLIGDFDAATFKSGDAFFLRIGAGSLGGKARGLAFVRHILHKQHLSRRFTGVKVRVPPAVVIGTDVFDRFLAENNLLDFAIHCDDDGEIQRRFLGAPLPAHLRGCVSASARRLDSPHTSRSPVL